MKHWYSVLIVLVFATLFAASKTQQKSTVAKDTFTFDYKSPTTMLPGSAGMVVALVKPNYSPDFRYTAAELFKRLKTSMAGDVEEIVVDKGFRLTDSYESLGEMVFDAKKTTDILIRVQIEPEFTAQTGSWTQKLFTFPTSYQYNGTASLVGEDQFFGCRANDQSTVMV